MRCAFSRAKEIKRFFLLNISLLCLLNLFTPTFASVLTFTTNTYHIGHLVAPFGVTATDINGDGKLDLIIASGFLTIVTNYGNSVFGLNATLSGGNFVTAADVNGDGYVDLLTPGTNSILIFTNNRSGVFNLKAAPAVGGSLEYFAVGDINGDGSMDLMSGNFQSNSVTILTNDGSGRFGFKATLQATNPLCVATADVNGDGSLDLITASATSNSVTIFTNDGFGNFRSNTRLTVPVGSGPNWLLCTDLNGDHKPDIVTANFGDNTLTILTNDGSGIFGSNATVSFLFDDWHGVSCVASGDLNGDGKPDLVAVNSDDGQIYILTNNGSGVFGINTTLFYGQPVFPPNLTWVITADLNGDGKADFITANGQAGTVSVYFNTSVFPPPNTAPTLNARGLGKKITVSWPSDSAGWSLQQNPDLTTSNWGPSGYDGYVIDDDGTNKNLIVTPPRGSLFFRLLHP